MKKLIVLFVLLGLASFPLMADVTFGGDATYGFIAGTTGFGEAKDATVDLTAVVDDYCTVSILTNLDAVMAAASPVILEKAVVAYDLAGGLGLADLAPVGVVLTAGYDDPDRAEFEQISGYGNEAVSDFSPDEYWGLDLLVTAMDMVNFEFAINPGNHLVDPGYILVGAYVEDLSGVSAEVYYFQNKKRVFEKGQLSIAAAYSTAFGDISLDAGAGFTYDLAEENGDLGKQWLIGVGLGVGYAEMVALGVGVDMNSMEPFNGLTADVNVTPIDLLGLYAGLVLSFAEGADAFQAADLGVNLNIGAGDIYVGYLVTTLGVGDLNAPATPTDGGFYIKTDIDY